MITCEKFQPPADAIEALARCLYPAIRSYFESEEGRREFDEWKSCQDTEQTADRSENISTEAA